MKDHPLDIPLDADAPQDDARPTTSRRNVLRALGKVGLGAFVTASAVSARPRQALAQSQTDAVGILNFALTLEYLEAVYYNQGLATDGLIPDGPGRDIYGLIADHENKHVAFLMQAIENAGGTPVGPFDESSFDFTAGGAFPDPFADYGVYLALSQAFEDTGVRAYKGQAGFLRRSPLLIPALQIHALEARHAAEVRAIRASMGADVQPWITNADLGGLPEGAAAVYAGEDNVTQAGVNLVDALSDFSMESITEAFDEPLTMDEVNTIAGLFLA